MPNSSVPSSAVHSTPGGYSRGRKIRLPGPMAACEVPDHVTPWPEVQLSVFQYSIASCCSWLPGRAAAPDEASAVGFAGFFIAGGVEAYLGTFWSVVDTSAGAFAAKVYSQLLAGKTLGQPVVLGRAHLYARG